MLKHAEHFKIKGKNGKGMSLHRAIKKAKQLEIFGMCYDPLGIHTPDSWYWCADLLEHLKQEGEILSFTFNESDAEVLIQEEGAVH